MHRTARLWPTMVQHLGRKCLIPVGFLVAEDVEKCVVLPVGEGESTLGVVAEHNLAFTSVPQQWLRADGERVSNQSPLIKLPSGPWEEQNVRAEGSPDPPARPTPCTMKSLMHLSFPKRPLRMLLSK